MRLRSKGLGRKEMVMDFREYEAMIKDNELVIVGIIREPVTWDFSIRFCEDDYPAILDLALRKATLKAVFSALFHRFKNHHWSTSRDEHIKIGRNNRELIQDEVETRVEAAMRPLEQAKRTRRSRNEGKGDNLIDDDMGDELQASVV